MGLLDKFNSIEITADTRISEADREFCQIQQEAYDHARDVLKFMAERSKVDMDEQMRILGKCESEVFSAYTYLGDFKPARFVEDLHSVHSRFIAKLFSHFRHEYHVTIEDDDAARVLLPQKPDCNKAYHEEEWLAYENAMNDAELKYQDILEQIFIQLGGFSFEDKAIQEMKQAAHNMAWNTYRGIKCYEQKKAVLSFSGYACSFDSWHEQYYDDHEVKLSDGMKDVVRALAHFEFGRLNFFANGMNQLLGYNWKTYNPEMQFDLTKIKSIKCFKNGRVDVRFTSETYAREFAEEYLGTAI